MLFETHGLDILSGNFDDPTNKTLSFSFHVICIWV
jgi:hypothetical protein